MGSVGGRGPTTGAVAATWFVESGLYRYDQLRERNFYVGKKNGCSYEYHSRKKKQIRQFTSRFNAHILRNSGIHPGKLCGLWTSLYNSNANLLWLHVVVVPGNKHVLALQKGYYIHLGICPCDYGTYFSWSGRSFFASLLQLKQVLKYPRNFVTR